MNSKQIIITFITLITLIGAGWYCYRKFKPSTPNSTNEPINTIDETPTKVETSQTTKKLIYKKGSKIIETIEERDKNEKLVKTTWYQDDGETIASIKEYNKNEKPIKQTWYRSEDQTIKFIDEYNPNNGQKIKEIKYYPNGQVIDYIKEYNENGNIIKSTEYNPDGTKK